MKLRLLIFFILISFQTFPQQSDVLTRIILTSTPLPYTQQTQLQAAITKSILSDNTSILQLGDSLSRKNITLIDATALNEQGSSIIVPDYGCPDPIEVNISKEITLIAFDSEYWLLPQTRKIADSCMCTNLDLLSEKLGELAYENRDKLILIASYHPMLTYGIHGGYHSAKQHLFPLTSLWNKLYLPLPVAGSIYPILRTTVFQNPEDRDYPTYTNFVKKITSVFNDFPNVIYLSGHENGQQFIHQKDLTQVVSGRYKKDDYIHTGKNLLYKSNELGFVTLDQLVDGNMRISYYTIKKNEPIQEFSYIKPYDHTPFLADSLVQTLPLEDSITTQANPKYDLASKLKRFFLGENYREEWSAETKLPVLHLSTLHGGLQPIRRGGGMQSVSLRLADPSGKEWVLRSVNKRTESLIPPELQGTFVQDILDDATSAQHPYSALIVPPLADVLGIAHANPIIGYVAPDNNLAVFNKLFANNLALLEEREPLGDSDNSPKMLRKLQDDNDNTYKAKAFLRARMLDVMIGDWDRHEDQWRWYDENQHEKGKDKDYNPIPRDRDQVLRVTDGFIMKYIYKPFVNPIMQGFSPKITRINYAIFKSKFLNANPKNQFSYENWQNETTRFRTLLPDSVIEQSVRRLPSSSYRIRGKAIAETLKSRRDALPAAMDKYYRFINNIVDIRLSDKNELIHITDTLDEALHVQILKINKEGQRTNVLMDKIFTPDLTKEIRIYLSKGKDLVHINNIKSKIRLRLIGDHDDKTYHIEESLTKIKLYDNSPHSLLLGQKNRVRLRQSTDSANVAFQPVNLYNSWLPLLTAGYNVDDGVFIGGGALYTHQRGFRKSPFTYKQQLTVNTAFKTGAYKVNYKGQWTDVFGKADLIIEASVKAPDNTQNFFGVGNNSLFLKDQHDVSYYRTRFNIYQLSPRLQWSPSSTLQYTIGAHIQSYHFDIDQNEHRFIIREPWALHSPDNLTIERRKAFAGLTASLEKDNRDNQLNPKQGGYLTAALSTNFGLNQYSDASAQLTTELGIYLSVANKAITFANRIGGGTLIGRPAFYQYLFLGGHGNLRGFRQYRFAGKQLFYNNFETRVRVREINSYITPGDIGLIGMYDIGKVWAKNYNSGTIHQGYGGGIYYILANTLTIQLIAARSIEGWYPYFSTGFRF